MVEAPNYELAYEDYKKDMKYKDIAEKYGVTLSAVKSWASRYWKDAEWLREYKKGCNLKKSQLKKVATKGGQPGNKNAVGNAGGGAPEQNKNAIKTGEFEALFFDALEPEERQLVALIEPDKEALSLQEIQLLTVRERRMLRRIESIRRTAEDVGEDEAAGMTAVEYSSGHSVEGSFSKKKYVGALGQIQAIEEALTRVQAQRQRAIDSLHRMGCDDNRMELELLRLELEISTKGGSTEPEIEDDGFMAAMNAEAAAVWDGDGSGGEC